MRGIAWTAAALALLVGAGCQKVRQYGTKPGPKAEHPAADEPSARQTAQRSAADEKPAPLPSGYAWMAPTADGRKRMEPAVPLRFVHRGTDPAGWDRLEQFWTLVEKPATPLGPARREVLIKVPLGLDDPTPHIPPFNPPTAGKWALGKRLFFDDGYLWPRDKDRIACATCHRPGEGFTDPNVYAGLDRRRAATLFNAVYNRRLFWDGRASALEEVVQRRPADEREPAGDDAEERKNDQERRHVWSGVIKRLRADQGYRRDFLRVFGTPPTQDAVGKALATYLRTILIGDSLYDRAHRAAGAVSRRRDYEKELDADDLKALGRAKATKAEVARDLVRGHELFHGKARCARCHGGANFTDNGFHNVGVPLSDPDPAKGRNLGRFAVLPPGLKDRRLIGAHKTPTLRGLPQEPTFFHNGWGRSGGDDALAHAVVLHTKDFQFNPYLDAALHDPGDPTRRRNLKLTGDELHALLLFLRALDGKVDEVVADPKKRPEGVAAP
jgi:cytochrome c peroxidase